MEVLLCHQTALTSWRSDQRHKLRRKEDRGPSERQLDRPEEKTDAGEAEGICCIIEKVCRNSVRYFVAGISKLLQISENLNFDVVFCCHFQ